MAGKFPLGRAIAVCAAVFLLGVAGSGFLLLDLVNRAYSWHRARFNCPAAVSVDFSTPGIYAASFEYALPMGHPILGLDIPRKTLSQMRPDVLLSGLEGTYAIVDADGTEIFGGPLIEDPNNIKVTCFGTIMELRQFGSWYGEVKWRITATVTKGAARLEGIPQRLVFIDTGEALRSIDSAWAPYGCLVCAALPVAVIILIVVAGVSLRKSKQPRKTQETSEEKAEKGRDHIY